MKESRWKYKVNSSAHFVWFSVCIHAYTITQRVRTINSLKYIAFAGMTGYFCKKNNYNMLFIFFIAFIKRYFHIINGENFTFASL